MEGEGMSELESGPFRGVETTGDPPDRLFGAAVAAVGLFFADRAESFLERQPTRIELRELETAAQEAARTYGATVNVEATILPPEDGGPGWRLLVRVSEPTRH